MKSIEKHALLMFMTTFARKAILVDPMDMASSSPATVVKAAVLDTKSTKVCFLTASRSAAAARNPSGVSDEGLSGTPSTAPSASVNPERNAKMKKQRKAGFDAPMNDLGWRIVRSRGGSAAVWLRNAQARVCDSANAAHLSAKYAMRRTFGSIFPNAF